MTAKQYNFTKQNGVVMKARKRFTKQNGVVKQILAGWTKRNGVVEQVYSRDRISQPITFVPITDAWDYCPIYATVDAIYAVKDNVNNLYKISNYWDSPEITQMEYNGISGSTDQSFFNYAGGDTKKQSFLGQKSNYSAFRETFVENFDYVSFSTNGYATKTTIKLGDNLLMTPNGTTGYYEINLAIKSIQTKYWDEDLPVSMSATGPYYGAITLLDGFGVMVNKNGSSLFVMSYNNGIVKHVKTTIGANYVLPAVFTPNGQDVIIDLPTYGNIGRIAKYNPVANTISTWTPLGSGGVIGAYGGFVFYIRNATNNNIAFYVDKYNISGEVVSTLEVPLPEGVTHPETITTDYDYATKHSGRFAAIVIGSTHQVVFDLAKI